MANFTLIVLDGAKTTGTQVSATQVSQQTSVPTLGIGKGPAAIQLIATGFCHVKLGATSAISASTSDFMVGTTPVVLAAKGVSNVAYIADVATVSLNIGLAEIL